MRKFKTGVLITLIWTPISYVVEPTGSRMSRRKKMTTVLPVCYPRGTSHQGWWILTARLPVPAIHVEPSTLAIVALSASFYLRKNTDRFIRYFLSVPTSNTCLRRVRPMRASLKIQWHLTLITNIVKLKVREHHPATMRVELS